MRNKDRVNMDLSVCMTRESAFYGCTQENLRASLVWTVKQSSSRKGVPDTCRAACLWTGTDGGSSSNNISGNRLTVTLFAL